MSVWDTYQSRITAHGSTKRGATLNREQRFLAQKMKDSLSYHPVTVDGDSRNVSIINSDNLNEKTMCSLPGEDFDCGGLVEFADNYWLITEKDANNEVYTKVKLVQCNYLLHWVDTDGKLHEQWCIIEDGTKYLTGEYEDRNFVVTRGDSRIAMTIAKNDDTAKFGRENRFLIDDPDSGDKLAYLLTKPLKVGKTYGGKGIYAFVLQEVVSTDDDNMELSIADYYKYYRGTGGGTEGAETGGAENQPPVEPPVEPDSENGNTTATGRKVWL